MTILLRIVKNCCMHYPGVDQELIVKKRNFVHANSKLESFCVKFGTKLVEHHRYHDRCYNRQ